MSESQFDDLIQYLNEAKWFEGQAVGRMRDDWRDRTIARIAWQTGINALKEPGELNDRLPPDMQQQVLLAEAERKIAEAAKKKAKT